MNDTKPGADELRMRAILRTRGIGPDATPPLPAVPPKPTSRPRDWLDDILDSTPTPAAPTEEIEPAADTEPEPEKTKPKPARKPKAKVKAGKKERQADSPRQSLLDAYQQIPPRPRWLAYHATAAGAGWWLGWVDWGTDTAAWFAAGHWTTTSAWVLYGLGACACGLYRRSRSWAWPAAWAAAVPVSSVVLGVLLYAPTQ
jgi:hypothetical protein